jgi:peptide-methionine (S)-S-oxide reductase
MDSSASAFPEPEREIAATPGAEPQSVVLAGGCFWCTEAVFGQLEGVLEVTSGYVGDSAAKADYGTVCSGETKHAEAVRIRFDPTKIRFGELLKVFFSIAHDPTQRDRQGNDVGPQYRSAIFFADPEQKAVSEAYIRQLDRAKIFAAPIATRLEPLGEFFEAESYHQDYAARNPHQPYIAAIALPKVAKLHKYYRERLKTGR